MNKFIILTAILFLSSFIFAQEDSTATTHNQTEEIRLATIKYGTEAEIAALIQNLKNENADYLDDEIIRLVETTRNQRILGGAFTFFGEREKSGLEERAIRAITERGDEANETVLAAVEYLGNVKAEQAAPVLRELLDNDERRFMNAVFQALGHIRSDPDDTTEYLIDYYYNRDPGDDNRRDLIIALGAVGSARGVSFLSAIAVDSEERMSLRIAALDSLSKIGDPTGLEAILACVSTTDPNIRSSAVAALGPFSGEDVDSAILEAFRDSYYRTRIAAAQASRQRKLVVAVPYLRFRAEQDDVANVKDEAIRALGAIANSEAMEVLNNLFIERKNPDRVRLLSAEMLMKNEPAKYLDRLIIELDEAKQKNMTPLYNGFLKIIGETKTENMESIARRLMQTNGIIEKSYALDIVANNNLASLSEEIKLITSDRNESLARKARRTLEKLGIE